MSWFHLHPWMTFILALCSICAIDSAVANIARARRLPAPPEQKALPSSDEGES